MHAQLIVFKGFFLQNELLRVGNCKSFLLLIGVQENSSKNGQNQKLSKVESLVLFRRKSQKKEDHAT